MSVALVAGTGGVPPHVAKSLMAQGRIPVICEMMGFASQVKGEFPRIPFRIETLGTLLETLKAMNVTEVCMVGAMRRPAVDPSAIDASTIPLVPRLQAALAKGDDGTLREIIALFEEQGFTVLGAHQIAPELLPHVGVHTHVKPPNLSNDLAVAVTALKEMGRADLGQALLVRDGHVIAREDDRGTDALLGDAADRLTGRDQDGNDLSGKGAVLYKAPKPGQELRVDMPVIGPSTAMKAAEAGLSGIVVAEGGVMVLDLPQVIAILDAQGMFLWVTP